VFIGIAAITTLISFGYGISSYVSDMSQKMGNDKLIIQPRGFGFGPPSTESNVKLDEDDLDAVRGVNGVKEATGIYVMSAQVEHDEQKKYVNVFGSDFDNYHELIDEVYTLKVVEGKELRGNEVNQAVLAYNYLVDKKIFEKALEVGDSITVNGQDIKIAGFYEAFGNPQDDSVVYMNANAMEKLFGLKNYYFMLVRAEPGENPTTLAEEIADELRDHRHQSTAQQDFFVQTFEQVIATFSTVLNAITGVVILLGFISVVVAAVNITNTMYATILERTKEIGVFKAIGARNGPIRVIFMLESGLLSLVGGVLGVIAGYFISQLAGSVISAAGFSIFTPVFSWWLVVGSISFAFGIGVLAGFLPAYRASRLPPVQALRYE
jgi:putative ABC transport system permease protein